MKVVWTRDARLDVLSIRGRIALDRPMVARRWATLLLQRVALLADFPRSGRIVPEFDEAELRDIVFGKHRVMYRVKNETVRIVRVWDARRLPPDRVGEAVTQYLR